MKRGRHTVRDTSDNRSTRSYIFSGPARQQDRQEHRFTALKNAHRTLSFEQYLEADPRWSGSVCVLDVDSV